MDKTISRAELDFLVRRAGLTLTEDQAAELLAIYPKVRAMAERVRQARGREAEPAHVFVPGAHAP